MIKESIVVVVVTVVCCFFAALIATYIGNPKSELKKEKRFKEIASDNVFNKPIAALWASFISIINNNSLNKRKYTNFWQFL